MSIVFWLKFDRLFKSGFGFEWAIDIFIVVFNYTSERIVYYMNNVENFE